MGIRVTKAYDMSSGELRQLIDDAFLTHNDVAWLTGAAVRTVRSWVGGEYPVPQAAALLLLAYRDNRLKVDWFMTYLGKPPGVE
jgi:hypothetical protein